MLFSMTTVFAENELEEFQTYDTIQVSEYEDDIEPETTDELVSNNKIDASEFTEDNVLYKAMQSKRQTKLMGLKRFSAKKEAAQNTENESTDEVTADFDIIMNFDMSSDMYDFDVNGDKEWLEDFKAIAEQAPNNTRYAVVSDGTEGFTYDLEASIEDVQSDSYTGESDIITILDDSAEEFDDDSDNRNKVVIATTQMVDDADELENKLDELRDDDIIPFVFVLNEETDDSLDIDRVYQCTNDLELRLAVSDLYLSFEEYKRADSNLYNSTNEKRLTLSSVDTANDYKTKHKYGDLSSPGEALISILNIYNCIPLIAKIDDTSIQYDLFDLDVSVLNSFLEKDNKTFSESNNIDDLVDTWDNIFDIIHNKYTTNQNTEIVITNNLKRRFPVFAYSYNSSTGEASDIEIIINANDVTEDKYVFDTYEYLMNTISNSVMLHDAISNLGELTIETTYPSWYSIVKDETANNTVRKKALDNEANLDTEVDWNIVGDNVLKITTNEERRFVVGSQVTYSAGLPDIANVNKIYYTRKYADIHANHWAYDYIISSTNKGIVQGFDDGTFQPDGEVTRGQFVLILLKAAQINADDTTLLNVSEINSQLNNADFDMPAWIKGYMNYAFNNGLVNAEQYIGQNGIDTNGYLTGYAEPLDRAEASFILNRLFIEKANDVNVPSNIYNYDGISNHRTDLWENHNAFAEQKLNNGNNSFNDMYYIKQMYYNNVLDGMYGDSRLGDDTSKIYFYPNKTLTRAEACKIILKCLFELDDNISEIQANVFEDYVPEYDLPNGEHITTRYILDGNVPFDASNQIVYHFTIDDDYEYAIETTGGDETTYLWGRMFNKTKHKVFKNISIENSNHMLIIFKGAGDYDLRIKRTGQADVGLRIKRTGMSDLQSHKRSGGNSIFINSPEYLSHVHTLSALQPEYIFNQDNITGYNTLYATHFLPGNNGEYNEKRDLDYINHNSAYYDLEFYNPSNEPVTIRINSIGYDSTTYGYGWYPMRAISNYFKLPITTDSYKFYECNYRAWTPQEPKEILQNLNSDQNGDSTNEFTVMPNEHYFLLSNNVRWENALAIPTNRGDSGNFIYLYTDFEVLNGQAITLRTAVDYEQDLFLTHAQQNNVSMGNYNYLDDEVEQDIASKVKGIEWGHISEVDHNMEYIITENNIGEKLKQNIIDREFYEDYILSRNPVDQWASNLNPYFDVRAASNLLMPSGLMSYEYTDIQGKWSFAYDRIIGLGKNDNDEVDEYNNRLIVNDMHPLDTKNISSHDEIMRNLINGTNDYPWQGLEVPARDPATGITLPESVRNDAKNGYLYAQSLGEWGVDQYYSVKITNATRNERTVVFYMKSYSPAMLRYKVDNTWRTKLNLGESHEFNDMFELTIPANSIKEFDFSYITSAAEGYCEHYFKVVE